MYDHGDAWGSPNREYAYDPDSNEPYLEREFRPAPDVECQSSLWSRAVGDTLGDDLRTVVERTVKQWNSVVRECLRKQTGLRLSPDVESNRIAGRNRKVRSVPVRVVNGLPVRFAAGVQDVTGREITLLLNKSKLDDVESGTAFMVEQYQKLPKNEGSCATREEIKKVQEFATYLLKCIENHDKSKWILEIDEDVLGAYFFRVPEIRLYWIVIGVYSQILQIPIESLTVVVLIHELAHAYTHLGYDIDNRDWSTEGFAQSDVYLVEGLAQFYTKVVCEQIKQRLPTALNAFEKLLEGQSDVYKEHKNWLAEKDSKHVGETIRISMLDCRSKGICDRSRFQKVLNDYRDKFR